MLKRNSGKRASFGSTTTDRKSSKTTLPLDVTKDKLYGMIQVRAFELYCQRDPHAGNATSDWVKAEQQIKAKLGLSL